MSPKWATLKQVDDVFPSQGPLLRVVEGLDAGDPEGVFMAFQGPDHMGGTVVVVEVGAQHQVGGHIQSPEAPDVVVLEGVEDHREVLVFQFKAGMAQPAQFQFAHRKTSFMISCLY